MSSRAPVSIVARASGRWLLSSPDEAESFTLAWPESWILAFGDLLQAKQVKFAADATVRERTDVRKGARG